ncbi:MAG: Ig-like domain-containing protein, partial [Blastocatellia bacterium]
LTVSAVTQPANGTVVNNGGNVSYTPNPAFSGTDTFTYTVSDGGATDTATVTVTVTPSATFSGLRINELEADPGDQTNDSCQYIELRGIPGEIVPANTYFVAIDSDNAFPGSLNHVVSISGVQVGTNGIIFLQNTFGGTCPGRTIAPGATVVNYSSTIRIGGLNLQVGSESFAILQTPDAIAAGQDRDVDDDGVLEMTITAVLDGVAFIIDPDVQFVYPDFSSPIIGNPFDDQPDAFTRFSSPGPTLPPAFDGTQYFWGELAASPVSSTVYQAPLSPNFPTGGALTPGAPNVP